MIKKIEKQERRLLLSYMQNVCDDYLHCFMFIWHDEYHEYGARAVFHYNCHFTRNPIIYLFIAIIHCHAL